MPLAAGSLEAEGSAAVGRLPVACTGHVGEAGRPSVAAGRGWAVAWPLLQQLP